MLRTKLESSLRIKEDERVQKARERNEDVAILSTFLPPHLAVKLSSNQPVFVCCLGKECKLGDPKKAVPGDFFKTTVH